MLSHPNTSLHIAIQNGNMEIINMLLADGCESLHTRNAEGQTPLDLATAMNNEEIVRLLLEHGAGHPPSPPLHPPPSFDYAPVMLDTEQRKKRISFWLAFVFILLIVPSFFAICYFLISIAILTSGQHPRDVQRVQAVVDAIYFLVFWFPPLIAYAFCYFFWLYRLWEEVPQRFARTTPGLAAGLSLIPVFHLYWMFVALVGLYQDMNKAMEAYGREKRFSTTLIIAACIIWLTYIILPFIMGIVVGLATLNDPVSPLIVMMHLAGCVSLFLMCIFYCVIYWIIRKNVFEFMDIKASLEK